MKTIDKFILVAAILLILSSCTPIPTSQHNNRSEFMAVVTDSEIPINAPTETQIPVPTETQIPVPTETNKPTLLPTATHTSAATRTSLPPTPIPVKPTAQPTQPPQTSGCPNGCTSHIQGCDIKGNISVSTGEKIYHMPGMNFYSRTVISPEDGERWFCTEDEAVANGWRKSKQ